MSHHTAKGVLWTPCKGTTHFNGLHNPTQPNHLQRGGWDSTKMHLIMFSPSSHMSWGDDESWWHWVVCPVGTGSLQSDLLPLHRNPKKLCEVIERYDLSKHQHIFSLFSLLHEPQGHLKSKLKFQRQILRKVFRHYSEDWGNDLAIIHFNDQPAHFVLWIINRGKTYLRDQYRKEYISFVLFVCFAVKKENMLPSALCKHRN